ncbi:MAG TPA: Re/Si-specific NAD(P)(+) transhydrogenase subunit alpha [Vicinamibacterales bacterium]|nr:Re/Si-specific NAD(P)(+) transhydrogenase subunit alpha [Vicinamibacterales bacterium]
MRIGIPAEVYPGETRVAATPETVKKFTTGGRHSVIIETNAGAGANIPDASFKAAGASLGCAADIYKTADIILKVRRPMESELPSLRSGSILIGLLSPHEGVDALAKTGVTAFSMELLPRITRAQNMDVLSSQANIAGYKAVLIAAYEYGRFMPMLMTAAGTVKAARVLVLGAGVAGLQAIATAKRLGAVIEAFDVRPAVKNEVESLGAKFVEVELSEAERKAQADAGGYAREMSDDYKRRQALLIAERAKAADIVITTALIPGRPAPVLVPAETVAGMKPGSVIVDMAVTQGGNCPLSRKDEVVEQNGVKIVAPSNIPASLAADSSALYARNLLNFTALLLDPKTGELTLNRSDEILAATLVCIDGAPVRS